MKKPIDLFAIAMESHLRIDAVEKKLGMPVGAGGSAVASGNLSAQISEMMGNMRASMAQRAANSKELKDVLAKQTDVLAALLAELRARKMIQ